jgi:hypothetical protein
MKEGMAGNRGERGGERSRRGRKVRNGEGARNTRNVKANTNEDETLRNKQGTKGWYEGGNRREGQGGAGRMPKREQ